MVSDPNFLSNARHTVRSFGIRRKEKIACYVIVRGKKAMQLLESGLKVMDLAIKSHEEEKGVQGGAELAGKLQLQVRVCNFFFFFFCKY
ncbi:hypothetical protein CsSME_00027365 [Camellia sinensis var. sinensis]